MTDAMAAALGSMVNRACFFVYKLSWNATRGKYDKTPIAAVGDGRMTYAAAFDEAARIRAGGQHCTVGMRIDAESKLFFLDIDHLPSDHQATELASRLVAMFPNAYVSWSTSKRGLHVIGKRVRDVAHSCRNNAHHLEFYTDARGVALNIDSAPVGCVDSLHDVSALVGEFFPPKPLALPALPLLSTGVEIDDDALIASAQRMRPSAAAAFGGKATFSDLWSGNCAKDSESDMSLACHLARLTGRDSGRIERLMRQSGLRREKWDTRRGDVTYLAHTIQRACAAVTGEVHTSAPDAATEANPNTELANAYRMTRAYGADLMAVQGIGWFTWGDAGPWVHDDHQAHRLAFKLGAAVRDEAEAMQPWVDDETVAGSDEAERRAKVQANRVQWAKASESRAVISNSLTLTERLLTVTVDALDAEPLLVGTPRGVIDLTTCTFREHRREDRITKLIACDYDPAAAAPLWREFVTRIMGGDAELAGYLQKLAGYMLSGVRGEHILPVFYGGGANGKSTFLSTLQSLLGSYAGTAAPGLLLTRKDSDQLASVAALRGLRLAVVSESGETDKLDESRVKMISGGDRLTGRSLYQNFIEFTPTHLAVLQTNARPRVNDMSEGIWRRLKLIPFNVTIPVGERDADLPRKLRDEFPGILAWAVEGWRQYQREGLCDPSAVAEATATYRTASDVIGQFVSDACALAPNAEIASSALYRHYSQWAEANGERPMTQKAFSLRLSERPGVEKMKSPRGMVWRGIGLPFVGLPMLKLVK